MAADCDMTGRLETDRQNAASQVAKLPRRIHNGLRTLGGPADWYLSATPEDATYLRRGAEGDLRILGGTVVSPRVGLFSETGVRERSPLPIWPQMATRATPATTLDAALSLRNGPNGRFRTGPNDLCATRRAA
jgi:hypothetical protein